MSPLNRVLDDICLREEIPETAAAPPGRARRRGGLAMRSGVRLAVDVGRVRIGVARCDPAGLLASPLVTVARGRADIAELTRLAAEHEAAEIIVGLPTGLSGREGPSAADARRFAIELAAALAPVPVRLADERFTTVIAHGALRQGGRDSRARRSVIDQAAAALLLQGALDTERSTGRPAGELVAPAPGAQRAHEVRDAQHVPGGQGAKGGRR